MKTVFSRGRLGLVQGYTQHLFDPMPKLIIVIALTAIEHAIREYSTGQYRRIKFEGNDKATGMSTFVKESK